MHFENPRSRTVFAICGFHCHTIIKTFQQIKSSSFSFQFLLSLEQPHKDSGLRDVSCGRYSKKCFTQT